MKKIGLLLLTGIMVCNMTACSFSSTSDNNDVSFDGVDVSSDIQDVDTEVNEDYFLWESTFIVGLTEDGIEQEHLTIPAKCTNISGSILFSYGSKATSVSFESDQDMDIDDLFYQATNLVSVELPSELTQLESCAFIRCSSLEEITIPEGVTVIEDSTFRDCENLKTVVLEGDITSIDQYAFYGCLALESINLPDSITSIGKLAFWECMSLTEVTLPSCLVEVYESTFGGNGINIINVPSELQFSLYDTTSFAQADHIVTINVVEGSWCDIYFDEVFLYGVKNYM